MTRILVEYVEMEKVITQRRKDGKFTKHTLREYYQVYNPQLRKLILQKAKEYGNKMSQEKKNDLLRGSKLLGYKFNINDLITIDFVNNVWGKVSHEYITSKYIPMR